MNSSLKVVVDECVGLESPLFKAFKAWLGDRPAEFLFLATSHPGIPDVEILDKLLNKNVILLTNDRVLHNRVCALKQKSYTFNKQQQLTRRLLKGVICKKKTIPSLHKQIEASYLPSQHEIANRLLMDLPEKRLKRIRTARRRIRSYFDSFANISQSAITIGVKKLKRHVLCGYKLRMAGHNGVTGLAASEGYCITSRKTYAEEDCLIYGLQAIFCLNFDQVPIDVFIIPDNVFQICNNCVKPRTIVTNESTNTLEIMLAALSRVSIHPCVKGRFHDEMNKKLTNLAKSNSNEIRSIDFVDIKKKISGVVLPDFGRNLD